MSAMRNSLPPDVMKMAKQMGVSLDGFEAEAEEIWKKLDDMASSDPHEYQNFIQEQYESSKTADDKEQSHSRYFRPESGFSIQTESISGDGIKVRTIDTPGKTVFINFCSSPIIEPPTDRSGAVVHFISCSAGMQIPLVVSKRRDLSESTLAIDVVFNVAVIESCLRDKQFKEDVVRLAIDWIPQEAGGLTVSLQWKCSDVRYHGGLGEKGEPCLFFINPNDDSNRSTNEILADPSTLLNSINEHRSNTVESEIPSIHPQLISEVFTERQERKVKNSHRTIKPGFLNGKNAGSLYPEGSQEGKGGASGGALARVMEKCKIVNSQGEVCSSSSSRDIDIPLAEHSKRPSEKECREIENLCSEIDDEWKESQQLEDSRKSSIEHDAFGEIAKLFLGHTASTAIASSSCDVPKPDRQSAPTSILQASGEDEDVKVSLDLSDTAIVAQAVKKYDEKGVCRLCVEVTGLLSDFRITQAKVDVSVRTIIINLPHNSRGRNQIIIQMKSLLDCSSTKASFSRKKGLLSITVVCHR